jgi:hypothetical protein
MASSQQEVLSALEAMGALDPRDRAYDVQVLRAADALERRIKVR